jgi:hypothetical protein
MRAGFSIHTQGQSCTAIYIFFQLNVRNIVPHHRDTEHTEETRRLDYYSTLYVISVCSVLLW